MIGAPAPFPHPGSYALYVDTDLPAEQQSSELVRIQWRRQGHVTVAFPLRDGASGTKAIAEAELVDATPLSSEEQREFHDLDRSLAGRDARNLSKALRARKARRDTLLQRVVWAPHMARLLRDMRARQAGQQQAA